MSKAATKSSLLLPPLPFPSLLLPSPPPPPLPSPPLLLPSPLPPSSPQKLEECVRCVTSGKVRYSVSEERVLRLPVAMEAATNLAAYIEWERKKAEKQSKKERMLVGCGQLLGVHRCECIWVCLCVGGGGGHWGSWLVVLLGSFITGCMLWVWQGVFQFAGPPTPSAEIPVRRYERKSLLRHV